MSLDTDLIDGQILFDKLKKNQNLRILKLKIMKFAQFSILIL